MGRFDDREKELDESLEGFEDATTEVFVDNENKGKKIDCAVVSVLEFIDEDRGNMYLIQVGDATLGMTEDLFCQVAEGVLKARQKIDNRNIERLLAQHVRQLEDKSRSDS